MELGRGLVLLPGEGERLQARGSQMFFKAVSASTGGRLSLMERTLPPGGRMPPPHLHRDREEAYFVLEGQVAFLVDGQEVIGESGSFVLVPGGVPHTFGNQGLVQARLLVIHVPGLDGYFRELQALWAGAAPPEPAQERELMARHGMEPA
ncbi:MAG TPA: cupin domain-containing protein [Candidatus Dormibacteraeota bacterium]